MIAFARIITAQLDGWSYRDSNGNEIHDCSLGALIEFAKGCGDVQSGDEIRIINDFEQLDKIRVVA